MVHLKYFAITLLIVSLLILFVFIFINKKPIRTLLINIIFGVLILTVINLTKRVSGIYIPVNWYTVLGACLYGIPFVIGFLLFNLIFI